MRSERRRERRGMKTGNKGEERKREGQEGKGKLDAWNGAWIICRMEWRCEAGRETM